MQKQLRKYRDYINNYDKEAVDNFKKGHPSPLGMRRNTLISKRTSKPIDIQIEDYGTERSQTPVGSNNDYLRMKSNLSAGDHNEKLDIEKVVKLVHQIKNISR